VFALTDNTHSTVLNGTDQYWSITDASQTGLDFTGDFTVSMWLNADVWPDANGENMGFVEKLVGGGNQRSYLLASSYGVFTTNTPEWRIALSSNGSSLSQGSITRSITSTGVWYHIVFAYDASAGQIEVFVDGVSEGTATGFPTSVFDGTAPVSIGASVNALAAYTDGQIDDVRAWSRLLSDTEISDLESDPCNFDNGASLQGQWLFDNDGTDETANANDLTNNSSATFSTDVAYSCAAAATPTDDTYFEVIHW
jgi:hypothetical protein